MALSTRTTSPSKMPASFMDSPRTRSRKVAWGCLISCAIRSTRWTMWSSAGDGKPAAIQQGEALTQRGAWARGTGVARSRMAGGIRKLFIYTVYRLPRSGEPAHLEGTARELSPDAALGSYPDSCPQGCPPRTGTTALPAAPHFNGCRLANQPNSAIPTTRLAAAVCKERAKPWPGLALRYNIRATQGGPAIWPRP